MTDVRRQDQTEYDRMMDHSFKQTCAALGRDPAEVAHTKITPMFDDANDQAGWPQPAPGSYHITKPPAIHTEANWTLMGVGVRPFLRLTFGDTVVDVTLELAEYLGWIATTQRRKMYGRPR